MAAEMNFESNASDSDPVVERQHVTGFGFYLYLLSDAILFGVLFATLAVLRDSTDGGPTGRQVFELRNVFIETACLLTSSFTCGLGMLATDRRHATRALIAFGMTFLLGVIFLELEVTEFVQIVHRGAGPDRSAFLSAFFTLVGTHGLHVTAGLLWLAVLLVQLRTRGFTAAVVRRLVCFSLFWHVIDIVWIGVFTFVYLIGARP